MKLERPSRLLEDRMLGVKKIKVDMSAEAVTARLRHAGGLGDAERLMTMIRLAMGEIESADLTVSQETPKEEKP